MTETEKAFVSDKANRELFAGMRFQPGSTNQDESGGAIFNDALSMKYMFKKTTTITSISVQLDTEDRMVGYFCEHGGKQRLSAGSVSEKNKDWLLYVGSHPRTSIVKVTVGIGDYWDKAGPCCIEMWYEGKDDDTNFAGKKGLAKRWDEFVPPDGFPYLVGFFGFSGSRLDRVGVVWASKEEVEL